MRATTILKATEALGKGIGGKLGGQRGLALLPPIPLYRRLLRAHRKFLPNREMRVLGDQYVRGEFRAHREVENPVHIVCLPHPTDRN